MDYTDIVGSRRGKVFALSPENPTGARGGGAQGKPWEKNHPCVTIAPGQTLTVADKDGPGFIRNMWFGGDMQPCIVLRIYWDGQDYPSVEAPLNAFFGYGYPENIQDQSGAFPTLNSAMILCAPCRGMNSYWPMPFRSHCRITLTNRSPGKSVVTYPSPGRMNLCRQTRSIFMPPTVRPSP